MSLTKNVRSKVYMNGVFNALSLNQRPRYGRLEFAELSAEIGVKYVGGLSTKKAIDEAIAAL